MTNRTTGTFWPPHVNALYQEDTNQLRFMKRQQWVITNYFLVLLGGILGIVHNLEITHAWIKCVSVTFILAALSMTVYMLIVVQADMVAPRRRLDIAYEFWPPKDRQKFDLSDRERRRRRSLVFVIGLISVCTLGAIAVGYSIIVR